MSRRLPQLLMVLLLLASTACSPEVAEPLLADGELALPRLEPDRCAGALRSEVVALDLETGAVRWRQEIPWADNTNVVAVDGSAISTSGVHNTWDGSVQALDIDDGQPLWQVSLSDAGRQSHPTTLAGGVVVVPRFRQVVALRPDDGSLAWTQEVDEHHAIAVTAEHLYIKDAVLDAIEVDTGDAAWSRPSDGVPDFAPVPLTDRLVIADYAGPVTALGFDGDQLWSWTPDAGGVIDVFDASDDHVVLLVGDGPLRSGQVTVLDSTSGLLRWQGPVVTDPVVLATDDLIFVTERDQQQALVAFDAATGHEQWTGELAQVPQWTAATTPTGTVIMRNDAYGHSASGTVTTLNDDSTPRWEITPGFNPVSAAALNGDQVLLWGHHDVDGAGAVMLLDAASGATSWHATLDRPVQAPPLPVGDALITLASDHEIDCS